MRYIPFAVRIVLDIVLAVVVWRNSHWSVALSITLIFLSVELLAVNIVMIDLKMARAIQKVDPVKMAAAMFVARVKEDK